MSEGKQHVFINSAYLILCLLDYLDGFKLCSNSYNSNSNDKEEKKKEEENYLKSFIENNSKVQAKYQVVFMLSIRISIT